MGGSRQMVDLGGGRATSSTGFQEHFKIVLICCLLLVLPSIGHALVDAPAPWLRALCSGGMSAPSCESLFGDVQGFILCEEAETTCSFNVRLEQSTCHQLCRSLGSTCVAAFDNENPNCIATPDSNDTCFMSRSTEICVCERRNDVVSQRVACEDAFGDASDFTLCREQEDRCEFAARTDRGDDKGNCNDLCRRFNTKCLGAIDNESNCIEADNGNMDDCFTDRTTEICICERPFDQ